MGTDFVIHSVKLPHATWRTIRSSTDLQFTRRMAHKWC